MRLSTHTWMRPEALELTLSRASRLGYQSIELAGEPAQYQVDEVRTLLAKYEMDCWGLVTVMHSDRDFISPSTARRAKTIEYAKTLVDMTHELGGRIVTLVPSTVGKTTSEAAQEDEWRWAVEGIRDVCRHAQEKGIRIAIEPLNRFETYFINRAGQALRLADDVGYDCCGIAFDPFHLSMEEKDMYLAIKDCGTRIFDVHLGDNNRLAPGDGNIDWKRFINALREVGYTGDLAFEAMPPIDRTPASPYIAIGGQLEKDDIAVDPGSLQFIKDHGSGVLSEAYYASIVSRCAETILPLL